MGGASRYQAVGGSSPRVRGTEPQARHEPHAARFIPACAGNGHAHDHGQRNRTVHPRVCGEREAAAKGSARSNGSSPRVRGTAGQPMVPGASRRFIPACAGNGRFDLGRSAVEPVHPRVCGERTLPVVASPRTHGSSPRVRGTDGVGVGDCAPVRFIPACAGNGSACPRAIRTAPGSSPRVRGTDALFFCQRRRRRFIPACAGNGPCRQSG